MRVVRETQMQMGEVDIAKIQFDPKSRDDIPQLLRGLQYLYVNVELREKIFALLEEKIVPQINKHKGRPGMALWKILVMGVLRLDLNLDYDRLHHEVNYDLLVRQMLGHGVFDAPGHYHLQTLKDNVSLLTPELLDEMNQLIVQAGHGIIKKKGNEALHGRCDSFVVETDVHFPTDINLLFDAMRKVISLCAELCDRHGASDWRQHVYNVKHVKRLMRTAQNKKRTRAKSDEQKHQRARAIRQAHQHYMEVAQQYLHKALFTLETFKKQPLGSIQDRKLVQQIETFAHHAHRQLDQIKRRVLLGEKIPHHEKVFSLFQPHTEWVAKGKAGVPVELGVKVCVLEDQHQFILHHHVMEKQTDEQVAVLMVEQAQQRFAQLSTCSFDKGFHSPANQQALSQKLDVVEVRPGSW